MKHSFSIDIGAFIWDKTSFNSNPDSFYDLAQAISYVFVKLEGIDCRICLRDDLQELIFDNFPWENISATHLREFQILLQQVFSRKGDSIFSFEGNSQGKITSNPNLIRDYFVSEVQDEVNILISFLHNENNIFFITFNEIWNSETDLKTISETGNKEHQTISCDLSSIDDQFDRLYPIFVHSPKHDIKANNDFSHWQKASDKSRFASRLSCHKNANSAQEILNKGIKDGDRIYSYDSKHDYYVTFMWTEKNIYHGYDEYDVNRIPKKIKDHFNKKGNGRG